MEWISADYLVNYQTPNCSENSNSQYLKQGSRFYHLNYEIKKEMAVKVFDHGDELARQQLTYITKSEGIFS